jgi:hypothetical protein
LGGQRGRSDVHMRLPLSSVGRITGNEDVKYVETYSEKMEDKHIKMLEIQKKRTSIKLQKLR